MPNGSTKRGRGKPLARIDLEELRKLCKLQCTHDEIAAYFNVTRRTIINHRNRSAEFRDLMDRSQQSGLISLRRAQFENALKGSTTMQIWLGKQLLGQKDRIANEVSGPDGAAFMPPRIVVNFVKAKRDDNGNE